MLRLNLSRTTSAHLLRQASHLAIGFGSQTGTAMTFAAELSKEAAVHAHTASLVAANDLVPLNSLPPDAVLVLICASCGEGEPTDNARELMAHLEATSSSLDGRQFAVFGLGNSAAYPERFNVVAKALHTRLVELGGEPLTPLGLGDDAGLNGHWIDDDFDAWKDSLWTALKTTSQPPTKPDAARAPGVVIATHASDAGRAAREQYHAHIEHCRANFPVSLTHPALLKTSCNIELHAPNSQRSARHIELDASATPLRYATGDHVGIIPRNCSAKVARVLDMLQLDPHQFISVPATRNPAHAAIVHGELVEVPTAVASIFEAHKDLTGPPSAAVLASLAELAADPGEAAVLADRAAAARTHATLDGSEYRPSLADVITDAPSLAGRLALEKLLDIAPPMKARFYSIASAAEASPTQIDLTVSVLRYGLCSNYLAGLEPGSVVRAFARDSGFRLPSDPTLPVMLIGAGAGVAPLRAFWRARQMLRARGAALGPAHLYLGCDRRGVDDLYADDIAAALSDGALTTATIAAQHEPSPSGAVFVQDYLRQGDHAARVRDLVAAGGSIYVCGRETTLGVGTKAAFTDLLGNQVFDAFVRSGRFAQDVFA
ncbi:NADPH-cytochrome P450 reductase [Thecamonas trahens ATCC 50062]|uniref:NADPH--hemoprotein reductase n=1 Tax=Thecamonas trahens ATCC 50062 TaxID=461836 RepID=A0A0L0DWP0_THETB|nr:NADPH-cytochrome P450 reductase [Thecamonas trahens ATCC 50062]KNC55953.1 NADPH-cytochrome P450 reductase [Thecamonas trahens ATCC 50062]|eukprot:XP_013752694.1 NADPH-cytochrome P450 reductase [Thecamonas trahens ATCC 50062]